MSKKTKIGVLAALLIGLAVLIVIYFNNYPIAVLSPEGPIGQKERRLILLAVGLSLIVVIPVYIMLIGFAWKYREGNKKAKYDPKLNGGKLVESIWWAVPLIIIVILGVATWRSSNELDPFKPLTSSKEPLTIQVIAMQWKWLFIYPQQGIASVNFVEFPQKTPLNFQITADAPMNSFWIPKLGGQIYAMSGMSTELHLMANNTGVYQGYSANISGDGFAGMKFMAKSVNNADFAEWSKSIQQKSIILDTSSYKQLAKPSMNNPTSYYSPVSPGLYNSVVQKFVTPPVHRAEGSI